LVHAYFDLSVPTAASMKDNDFDGGSLHYIATFSKEDEVGERDHYHIHHFRGVGVGVGLEGAQQEGLHECGTLYVRCDAPCA
jgi:hypothetical protein